MGIFEEYESYLLQYQKTYGLKTVVLYQNGMFFEIYGVDNQEEKVGLVKEVSEMLNIQMTRRKKEILDNDRSNFLMAGFPLNQLDRYVTMLTEEYQYTVVVVEQISPPPTPKRGVTNVVSPATNLQYLHHPQGNYLLSIYIELEGKKMNQSHVKPIDLMTIGLSAIDVSTGNSLVYEVCNLVNDQRRAYDETYRMIQTIQPKEIIVNTRNSCLTQEEIINCFDLGHSLIHCQMEQVPHDYHKLTYQNEFFGKIFKTCGLLSPIEYLDLESRPTATLSYLLLLDFCYRQMETIVQQINRPVIWNDKKHMILDNNCINQLNLNSNTDSNSKHSCIFNLIDQTSTALGKRLLRERLLLPLLNEREITQQYDCVDFFRQMLDPSIAQNLNLIHLSGHKQYYKYQQYEPILNEIYDIERLHRKLCLGLLQPSEFSHLHVSYQKILQILDLIGVRDVQDLIQDQDQDLNIIQRLATQGMKTSLIQYMEYYQKVLDLDQSSKYNFNNVTGSFFHRGYCLEIDQIQDQICEYESYFQQLATKMGEMIASNSKKPVVTYEHTDNMGYYIAVTTARYRIFEGNCQAPMIIKTVNNQYVVNKTSFEVTKNSTGKNCKIISSEMRKMSMEWNNANELLLKRVVEVYKEFLKQLDGQYHQLMGQLSSLVAQVDVYKSNAKTSLMYNYCRPQFKENSEDRSSLSVTQLRHPLIEQIQTNCRYVPQDVMFDQSQLGILLFGVNSVGKCYDPETPILMFSGEIIRCVDIQVGDQLMGDDSTPRNVLSLTRGTGQMYDIIPQKGNTFRVNGPHILVLRHSGYKGLTTRSDTVKGRVYNAYRVRWIDGNHQVKTKSFSYTEENRTERHDVAQAFLDDIPDYSGQIIEISVDDYMKKTNSFWKLNYYLYNVGVEFDEKSVDLDPYIVGHWLGDESSSGPLITTIDNVIVDYYTKYFEQFGLTCKYRGKCSYAFTTSEKFGCRDCNFFTKCLRKYNLINNKHIPKEYLINSRHNRLKLLAGLIDSDGSCGNGYGIEFTLKSKTLSTDLCYLSNSLGYMTTMVPCQKTCTNNGVTGDYWRTYIYGDNFDDIPLLLEYKRPTLKRNRNPMIRSFKIKHVGLGDYCGFMLDNNQRHLLGDFTVGHNSSLMKAIGISVILAQAGMYVPAQQMIYTPYHCVLTRIIGNDNLFRGLSSFAVEMGELRGILKRADQYSMVLGDEICHGTETISAVSLVASAIIRLTHQQSNFLFATHLHQLSQMERITQLDNVKMYHLKVHFDEQSGQLIYDRHLVEGSGSPIYGLEVAKAMDLDQQYISLANEIRKELMDMTPLVPIKKSKYNADVYIGKCGIPECRNNAETTHHINFQSNANQQGFIDDLQKNHKSNLIPLCRQCHDMLHDEQVGHWRYIIKGYVMTSNGLQLDYRKVCNESKKLHLKLKT
jgi:DNA mismatch repair ATPase MutS